MDMVKRGYQPVYRPKSYSFLEFGETKLGMTQKVEIVDSMGETWNALYRVEKQPDGVWKISGVGCSRSRRSAPDQPKAAFTPSITN